MVEFVFKCASCPAFVKTASLNSVKLKQVKRSLVKCKRCGELTKWSETARVIEESDNE